MHRAYYIYICNVYMGSWRAISNNIALRGRGCLHPRSNPEGAARGHVVPPEGFDRGRKKTEVEVAILLDIARQDSIYTIYTTL